METKFKVLDLLSKLYAGNTEKKERRATESELADLGKYYSNYKLFLN